MAESLNERIGEVIKRKRQKYKFTQSELGSRIGSSGSYISSIEAGTTGVRITDLEQMALHFHATAIELINEAAGKDEYRFTSANRERDAFLSLYDALGPEQRTMARQFLLFLRQSGNIADDAQ
jgi:transcriptional regulator with XRE-family HTH domain